MANQDLPPTNDLTKRAKARIAHMEQVVEELTQALDLPRDVKYDVLSAIISQEQKQEPAMLSQKTTAFLPTDVSTLSPDADIADIVKEESSQLINGRSSSRHRKAPRWIPSLAAAILVVILVGSLIVVLNFATHSRVAAPITYDQSGLYASDSNGVYRLTVQNGKLSQRWYYQLHASRTLQIANPYINTSIYGPQYNLVETPITVADGVVYFGGLEDDATHQPHQYIYALQASNGALLWRHQIDGNASGIAGPIMDVGTYTVNINLENGGAFKAPLIWHDMVYVNISTTSNKYILALSKSNGAIRWTYNYPNTQLGSGNGLQAVTNTSLYILDDNTLFALNTSSGKKLWSIQVPQQQLGVGPLADQSLQALQVINGVAYVSFVDQGDTSAASKVYAFNANNGEQIWQSHVIDGAITTPTVFGGLIYLGTSTGHVYALNVRNGAQVWSFTASDPINATPQVINGIVYVLEVSEYKYTDSVHIIALNALHGTRVWLHLLPDPNKYHSGAGELIVHNNIIYIAIADDFVYSLRASDGSIIQAYALARNPGTARAPTLTLIP